MEIPGGSNEDNDMILDKQANNGSTQGAKASYTYPRLAVKMPQADAAHRVPEVALHCLTPVVLGENMAVPWAPCALARKKRRCVIAQEDTVPRYNQWFRTSPLDVPWKRGRDRPE